MNNPKTRTDQLQQHSPPSNFQLYPVASAQSARQTPSVKTLAAKSQASRQAPYLQTSLYSDIQEPPQQLPSSSRKETPKIDLKYNLDPAYYGTSSWSFPVPVATQQVSNPASISHGTHVSQRGESAGATMAHSMTSELTDEDDFIDEEDLASWMAQDVEDEMRRSSLTSLDSKAVASRRPSTVIPRNLPIMSPFVSLETFTHNGVPLAEKVYVELQDKDFLRIVHIIQDRSTPAVTLRGWKFRRTREMNGVIEKKMNEVCWILHVDEDDPRDAKIQGMETVSVCDIVKRRRIRLTNQSFPALSFRDDEKKEYPETVENDRVLVCRYKYLCSYVNARDRASYKWCEKVLYRLREDECDQRPDNNMKDEELRNTWRGHTVLGGAQEDWLPGEKEFLRQEEVSHRGKASRSSLRAPPDINYSIGDPMKRGNVGSLLTEKVLQQSSNRTTQQTSLEINDLVQTDDIILSNDDVKEVPTSPTLRLQEQRQDWRKSHFNFAGFNGLPSDYDVDEDCGLFALRRGLRQSSIEPRQFKNKSPRIVEIDAQVKTSSSSGTLEKRYEGKITSRYYPAPGSGQKRRAEISLGSPARPTKRVHRGLRAETSKGDFRDGYENQHSRDPASLDSDRTLGRSQSPDSVREAYKPSRYRVYKTTVSGLLTPVSQRKGSVLGRWGDLDDIVDLTKPQAQPYGNSSGGNPSLFRHSGPFNPLSRRSVFSSDSYKTSSPRGKSSHPTSALAAFEPRSYLTLADMYPASPSSLPINPGLSQAYRMLSQQSSKAAPGPSSRRSEKQRYTFGDCFCGAGGMSRGAVTAGLRIKWGFDFNLAACQTYAMNFFRTPIYNVWANQFSEAKGDYKVDICHLSPPCQFFSDAHTIQGKDDDMNTASLFAIFNLLDKAKPRIVTLEQTSGLIRRHSIFFNAVILMFTTRGFSLRWKVMNCADFGLPQRRMRLFIIASW